MKQCLVCKKGEVVRRDPNFEWYECTNCEADTDRLIDGYLYPLSRRGTLCSLYTPVKELNVSGFEAGQIVEFLTVRKTKKQARIIHVAKGKNMMIIEEVKTGVIRFVIDYEEIAGAYDALFPINKVKYSGWWHRRIEFVS